jgi:hypothetical protein
MKKIEDDLITAELSRASQLSVENKGLRDERERLALDLKKRIWLLHGYRLSHLLYGDDGRMDCNVCFRGYAGATLEQCYEWEIADACALVAKAALTPAGGRGE